MNYVETRNPDGSLGSYKLPINVKNYLIDIDGTICDDIPNEEPERMPLAKEFVGAREVINKLYDNGHVITFFTSRPYSAKDVTVKWLHDHDFKYHNIIMDKPRGGNYHWIDDRDVECTKFTNWTELNI